MIKVVVIDTQFERNNWLSRKLSLAGFWVTDSVLSSHLAIASVATHKPHIVLIAPMSSKLEGAKLALSIMEEVPTPIILLYYKEVPDHNIDVSWCGAVTAMALPTFAQLSVNNELVTNIISNLQLMHIVPVVRRGPYSNKQDRSTNRLPCSSSFINSRNTDFQSYSSISPSQYNKPQIIGIASSTGGPKIVKMILRELPQNYPIPIVLVQHVSIGFNEALIAMLATDSNLIVQEATEGERPSPGIVYTAPAQRHLVVNNNKVFQFLPQNSLEGHCPSATAMFVSLAQTYASKAVGIILSGMGDDGADGLVSLNKAGGLTIAQAPASCLIDSMPVQAISRGSIKLILPPRAINNLLKKWASF